MYSNSTVLHCIEKEETTLIFHFDFWFFNHPSSYLLRLLSAKVVDFIHIDDLPPFFTEIYTQKCSKESHERVGKSAHSHIREEEDGWKGNNTIVDETIDHTEVDWERDHDEKYHHKRDVEYSFHKKKWGVRQL